MKHYYIKDNRIWMANEKMPVINEQWNNYNTNLLKWSESIQPCEISESELIKIHNYLLLNHAEIDGEFQYQIEVTDIIEKDCKSECHLSLSKKCICPNYRFKHPKQVEEIEAVYALLNTFGQYCTLNGIKLTDSNKVGQAVIDFLKSDIYEIFKNKK